MNAIVRHKHVPDLRESLRGKMAAVKKQARIIAICATLPACTNPHYINDIPNAILSRPTHEKTVQSRISGEMIKFPVDKGFIYYNQSGAEISSTYKTPKLKYGFNLKRIYPMEGVISYEVNGCTNTGWWIQTGIAEGTPDFFTSTAKGKKSGIGMELEIWKKDGDHHYSRGAIYYPLYGFSSGDKITLSMALRPGPKNTMLTIHLKDTSNPKEISIKENLPVSAGSSFVGGHKDYFTGVMTEQSSLYTLELTMHQEVTQAYTQILPKAGELNMRIISMNALFKISSGKANYGNPIFKITPYKEVALSRGNPTGTAPFGSVSLEGNTLTITTDNKN